MRIPTVVIAAATGAVCAAAAGVGVYVWRADSLGAAEQHRDRAEAAAQAAAQTAEAATEESADATARARRLRARWERAEQRVVTMAGCVQQVADEDTTGRREVMFGFVDLPRDQERALLVDSAEWLVGDAANEAAAEDGVVEPGEPVANDYYIRNGDPTGTPVAVAEDAVIVTVTVAGGSPTGIPAPNCTPWNKFASILRNPSPEERSVGRSPYWLTLRDDVIVRVVEQYLP